ncbi:MAG: tripartite tricarboxylate transporter substrate binding protein [Betaproteobacteria bacterium]|nr:tripartite tricarboxylate transporter substrate binding protein [Betaproteobacteria bacterium]
MRANLIGVVTATLFLFALNWVGHASAQDYPLKPIRIVSGPGTDVMLRLFSKIFADDWGQQLVAESMPAAGGRMATEFVMRANPDGYTLLNSNSSLLISSALGMNPVDLTRDLTPVALTSINPLVLAVHGPMPVKNVADLIALAKARPGQLNYPANPGTILYFASEEFKRAAGIDVVHIPYKTPEQSLAAILSGDTQMAMNVLSVLGPKPAPDKARILAITTAKRSTLMPDLPTVAETVPGFEMVGWNGLAAPAKTPRAIIDKLNAQVRRALGDPEVMKQMQVLGREAPPPLSPGEVLDYTRENNRKWARLVKESGVKVH